MYRRDALMRICHTCCEATNGVLLDSSPNMRALCAVRSVLREAREGATGSLAFAIQMAKNQFLHDSRTGEIRQMTDSEIEYVLSTDPAEVLEEFYQTYDVLSLQDAVGDFKPDQVAAAIATVQEILAGDWGGEEGTLFPFLQTLLGPISATGHPLNGEGMAMYREGLTPLAAQVYGLLTLSVLYDLANDEFRRGTSVFSDRFSSEFGELIETFDVGDEEGVVKAANQVYEMLVSGELTL